MPPSQGLVVRGGKERTGADKKRNSEHPVSCNVGGSKKYQKKGVKENASEGEQVCSWLRRSSGRLQGGGGTRRRPDGVNAE